MRWEEDIKIETKGNVFGYSIQRNGSDVILFLTPEAVGSGSIIVQDKKDNQSKVSMRVDVSLSAIPFYQYISFSNVKDAKFEDRHLKYTVYNNTGDRVLGYWIIIKYFDKNGKELYSDSIDTDMDFAFAGRDFDKASSLRPKAYVNENFFLSPYPDFDYAELALTKVTFSEGVEVHVKENDYIWFSSKTNQYMIQNGKKQTLYYSSLTQTERNKSDSFMLGYNYHLSSFNRGLLSHYGFHNIGEYISIVDDGSLFSHAGIQAGDMVVSVDNVAIEDDYESVEKAKAKMADGESVVFSIERPGVGIMDYRFTTAGGTLISTTAFSDNAVSGTISAVLSSTSILENSTVRSLISSCPSIGKSTKSTKEFYNSLSEYNRDFPAGKPYWRISIQNGVTYFADENNMTVLTYKPKGTASEISSVLNWWIKIFEALPTIQAYTQQNGISFVAEKRGGEDYAAYADANGVIDLTDKSILEKVLDKTRDNKGLMDMMDAFSAVGKLDTDGNGNIDTYEIFDYSGEKDWYVSDDGKFAIKPSNFRKNGSRYLFTLQIRTERTKETSDKFDMVFSASEDGITLKKENAIQDFVYKGNNEYSFTLVCDCKIGRIDVTVKQEYTFTVE